MKLADKKQKKAQIDPEARAAIRRRIKLAVKTAEDFQNMMLPESPDYPMMADAVVDIIIKNLDTRRQAVKELSILIREDQFWIDLAIPKKEFRDILQIHLSNFEKLERFEQCARIRDAIIYLDSKNSRQTT